MQNLKLLHGFDPLFPEKGWHNTSQYQPTLMYTVPI